LDTLKDLQIKQDLQCGFVLSPFKDLSYSITETITIADKLQLIVTNNKKLNIKASFIHILAYAGKKNVFNKRQHLVKCCLKYLANLFLYSPITHSVESSHDQTLWPKSREV
jgi:hypothetical protein